MDSKIVPNEFDRLIESYFMAVDNGTPPDRDRLLREYPEHAREIDEFLAAEADARRHAAWWRQGRPLAPLPQSPIVFGDYELLEEIARGGMGIVYKARHKILGRLVALKMVLGGAGDAALARFRAEAQAIARLRHPHIVGIHDFGSHDGRSYLAMDFIEGPSLAARLRDGIFPPRQAAACVRDVARAVAVAHAEGILHRDLKPGNILLERGAHPFVVDFGLAKCVAETQHELTQSGAIVGTPCYMAPEQAAGLTSQVGPASDVYSLGTVLYELMTGRPPLRGDTPLETMARVARDLPDSPRQLRPEVPRDLETICLKCLEKDPAARYQSADFLADELERYLRGETIQSRRATAGERLLRWARRHPAPAALIGLVFCSFALLCGGGIIYWRQMADQLLQTRVARSAEAEARRESERGRQAAETQRDAARLVSYVAQTRQALVAWESSSWTEARRLLDAHVPRPGERDQRGWEWYFVDKLLHQPQTVLSGHEGAVRSVAWSPAGDLIASVGDDGRVRCWDATNYRLLHEWPAGRKPLHAVAWNVVGGQVAVGGAAGEVSVWKIAPPELISRWQAAGASCESIAWHPDGKRIAWGDRGGSVWIAPCDSKAAALVGEHRDRVTCVAWRSDGARLLSVSWDGTALVWEPPAQKPTVRIDWLDRHGKAQGATWSPDGRQIALATWGGGIVLADALSGNPALVLNDEAHQSQQAIAFHRDGETLASIGYDRQLHLWSARFGGEIATFRGHRDWGLGVAWHPHDDRLATASRDGTVRVWDPNVPQLGAVATRAARAVMALRFNPRQARQYAFAVGNAVYYHDSVRQTKLGDTPAAVYAVAVCPAGSWVASASGGGQIHLWHSTKPELSVELGSHRNLASALDWSTDGSRLVSVDSGGSAIVWNTDAREPLARLPALWARLARGKSADTVVLPQVAWRPGAEQVALCSGSTLLLWNLAKNEIHPAQPAPQTSLTSLRWNHAGSRLAVGGMDGIVRLIEPETGEVVSKFAGHDNRVEGLAFSPDDRRLVSGSWDRRLCVWNLEAGELAVRLAAHRGWVQTLDWSCDGHWIGSGGWDATIRLWSAEPVTSH